MSYSYSLPTSSSSDSKALALVVNPPPAAAVSALVGISNVGQMDGAQQTAGTIELIRLENPELYEQIKAALKFAEPAERCQLRSDDIYTLLIFGMVFVPMAFEYFFSAQAVIPGLEALPFSIDSVILNTALTALLLYTLIKSGMVNMVSLATEMYKAPTFSAGLGILGKAIDFVRFEFAEDDWCCVGYGHTQCSGWKIYQ